MLYMMLSLSLGWTLAVAYKYHHSTLAQLKEKPAAKLVGVIGLLQVKFVTFDLKKTFLILNRFCLMCAFANFVMVHGRQLSSSGSSMKNANTRCIMLIEVLLELP